MRGVVLDDFFVPCAYFRVRVRVTKPAGVNQLIFALTVEQRVLMETGFKEPLVHVVSGLSDVLVIQLDGHLVTRHRHELFFVILNRLFTP